MSGAPARSTQLWGIVRKEVIDAVRDRRSALLALGVALFSPLLAVMLLSNVVDTLSDEKKLEVSVKNGAAAPELLRHLVEHRAEISNFDGELHEAEALIKARKLAYVLVIDEAYGKDLAEGEPTRLQLIYDSSRTDIRGLTDRLKSLLAQYSQTLAAMRLVARGVDPRVVRPLQVESLDVATDAERATALFSMLPMVLFLILFICTFNVAVDVTAGERERNSLEPLLVIPVERWVMVAGKWLATVSFGLGGMMLGVGGLAIALETFSFSALGFQPAIDLSAALRLFLLLGPLALVLPAAEIILAVFAKTFKEAQTYVSMLAIGLYAPTFVTMFGKVEPEGAVLFVPILAHQVLAYELISGHPPSLATLGLAGFIPLLLTVVLLGLITRLLGSERIVFGR